MLLTELNMLILQFVVLIFLFTIFTVLHIYKMFFFLNTIIYNIYTVSVMLLVVVEVVLGRVYQEQKKEQMKTNQSYGKRIKTLVILLSF